MVTTRFVTWRLTPIHRILDGKVLGIILWCEQVRTRLALTICTGLAAPDTLAQC